MESTPPTESASSRSTPTVARYERYKTVVQHAAALNTLDLDEIKRACQPEQPGFVTKVIRELANSGWLVADGSQTSVFRWNRNRGQFFPERWLDEKIFGSQIAHSPADERPRERLLRLGATELKTSELIAILIRSGRPGESAIEAAEKISRHYQDRLAILPAAGRGELKKISSAIEVTAYCQIMAGIELGRRVAEAARDRRPFRIRSSSEAIAFCEQQFHRLIVDAKQEEFHIVTLDTKHQVIDTHQITVGTLDASLVHPREVFRPAIKDAASSVLLVHNHPSGDATPSREDLAVTKRLEECGKTIGIDVLDHIVVGAFQSVSIREYR